MNKKLVTFFVWLLLLGLFLVLFNWRSGKSEREQYFEPAHFLADLEAGKVSKILMSHDSMFVYLKDSDERYATDPFYDELDYEKITSAGVPIKWETESSWFTDILSYLIPALFIVALLIFFLRRAQGDASGILSLRRTKAKLIPENSRVTFAEVGGLTQAKESLSDIVNYLQNAAAWGRAGARAPRGVLLEGPPGSGKTLLARAVAGETKASYFVVSASEFVEMFVGVGAARVRDTFEMAQKESPAVIFIDELDAVGRRRGSGVGAGHDEREQTLNQLLVCLDGINDHAPVVVIAATNRPDILDRALLRPGRFDRHIKLPPLSRDERVDVLKIHFRNKPLASSVALEQLADATQGYSGADLENVCNESVVFALRRSVDPNSQAIEISQADIDEACSHISKRVEHLNKLDLLLVESGAQLVQPSGAAIARVVLQDGSVVEGRALWADAAFVKILESESNESVVIPKVQILRIDALPGTEAAAPDDAASDPWANIRPDLA